MKAARAMLAIPATAVILATIAWMSDAPVRATKGDAPRLRLSWSARPERIEQCRELTQEELAARGEHMRQRVECVGRFATYDLKVAIDGRRVHQSVARGAGLRNDRPIFLLREIDVPPGSHRVTVAFDRRERHTDADDREHDDESDEAGISEAREERERIERARRSRAAIPRSLALDSTIDFRAGQVVIVTLDAETRSLKLLDGRQPAGAARK
jgi:hypothetical protein